uniref:HOOK N-terminal domain-containing protein n=1 Tax=Trichuris muris TaxID=70415 RepID=A0A5S6PZ77_TRIMR
MAVLDEKKVRSLINWLNLEIGSVFPPVNSLEQLTDFDQISWLTSHLKGSDAPEHSTSVKNKQMAVLDFLRRSYSASVIACLRFGGDGILSNDSTNLGAILALLLNYALSMDQQNERHVELVQHKMNISDQYCIMDICKTMAEQPDTSWTKILTASSGQTVKSNLDEKLSGEILNATTPSVDDSSVGNTSALSPNEAESSMSPPRRTNSTLSSYRKFRNSVRRKWELMRNTERQLAEKNAEIEMLTMEAQQLKLQLRDSGASNNELLSSLATERRNRQDCEERLELLKVENQELRADNGRLTGQLSAMSAKFGTLRLQVDKQQGDLEAMNNENEALRSQLSSQRSLAKSWHEKFLEAEESLHATKRESDQTIREQMDRIGLLQVEKRQLSDKLDEETALHELLKNNYSDQKNFIKSLLAKFRILKDCTEKLNAKLKTCESCLEECSAAKEWAAQLASKLESCMLNLKEQRSQNDCLTAELCRAGDPGSVRQHFTSTPRIFSDQPKSGNAFNGADEEECGSYNRIAELKRSLEDDLSNINNPEVGNVEVFADRDGLSNTSAKVQEILKNSINHELKCDRSSSCDTFVSMNCDGSEPLGAEEDMSMRLKQCLPSNDGERGESDLLSSFSMSVSGSRHIYLNPVCSSSAYPQSKEAENPVPEDGVFKRPAAPRMKSESDQTISSVEPASKSMTSTSSGTPTWRQWNRRLTLLNQRNSRYPLHLKSSYPIETQSIIDTDLEEELKQSNGLQSSSVMRVIDRLETTSKSEKKVSDKSVMRKAVSSARKAITGYHRNRSSKTSQAVSAERKPKQPAVSFFIGNTPRKKKTLKNNAVAAK